MKLQMKSLNHVIRDVVRRANPDVPAHVFDMYDINVSTSTRLDVTNPTSIEDYESIVYLNPKPEYTNIVGEEGIELKLNALYMNQYLDLLYETGFNVWATPKFEELGYYKDEFDKYGLSIQWEVNKKYYKNRGSLISNSNDLATAFLLSTINHDEPNKYGKTYGEIKGKWDKLVYDPNNKQIGLMLDLARTKYTKDDVRKAIDYLAQNKGTYIQLHITDNESIAYPFSLINVHGNGITAYEFADIVNYARDKGIEVIFELNTPGHCNAIKKAIEKLPESHELRANISELFLEDGTMNFNSWRLRKLVKDLIDEILQTVTPEKIKYFHIGGDEFPFNENWSHEIPEYYNSIQEHLYDYGITMRVWNDSLLKKDIVANKLDDRIEVTYWSWDGQRQDQEQAQHLRDIRATPKDLIDHDIRVINCQGYYTYAVPRNTDFTSHDATYSARDMFGKWDLAKWDNHETAVPLTKEEVDNGLIGAQLSIWGENLGLDHTDKLGMLNNYTYMMRNIARICKAYSTNPAETLENIKAIYNQGFVNEEYDVFMDLKLGYETKGKEGNVYDLSYNGSNVLYFNNLKDAMESETPIIGTVWGNGNDYVKLPKSFIKDDFDTIRNSEYNVEAQAWKYKNVKIYIDERIKVIYVEIPEYPYQPKGKEILPTEYTKDTYIERRLISIKPTNFNITIPEEELTKWVIQPGGSGMSADA